MRSIFILLIALVVLGLVAFFGLKGPYNNMVNLDEEVNGKWAEVETQYMRRFDLIDNLVKTVKASADFEKSTLVEVTEARASAFKAMQNAKGGTNLEDFNKSEGRLNMAVGGMRGMLMGYAEKYPDLQTTKSFQDLMVQLEGTENRIAKARGDFNEEVKGYNKVVRGFPNNMIAGMFGFQERDYFEAAEGSDVAPDVGETFGS